MNPLVSVKLDQSQRQAMERKLDRFAASIARPKEANRQAAIALYGWTIRNFDKQNAFQGGWVPLSPTTVKEKKRLGKEVPLVRSGQMRQGFNQFYDDQTAGVGNPIQYSYYHQFGVRKKHLPARPLLPYRNVVLQIGLKVYGAYVQRQVAKANA